MRSNCPLLLTFALFASVVLGQSDDAQAATTRFVATNSTFNGTGCGSRERPCRTIATNNYWDQADGPGPNPGDRAFGVCLVRGSIVTSPFATTPFPAAPVTQVP